MGLYNLNAHRLATLGLLTAASLIVFVIENFFPPLFLPGAKLGLANIFTLITIIMFSPIDAFILTLVRCLLGNILVGNMSALMYSLPAGLITTIISSLLIHFFINKISLISISIFSAVIHNIIQNMIFCGVTNTPDLFIYTPYLAILGVFSGLVVGILSYLLVRYIPKQSYSNTQYNNFNDKNINDSDNKE